MESIDKLREWETSVLVEESSVTTIGKMCDEIEAEIAERYMLLPVDADGVTIHVGDRLDWCGHRLKVCGICSDSIWFEPDDDYEEWRSAWANECTHVKPDPLKELLHDACMNATRICCEQGVGTNIRVEIDETGLAEYAERIRELMEVDA